MELMTPEGSRVACFTIQRHPGFRRLKVLKCCRNKQRVWEWLPFSGASHRDSNSGHWNSDLGISNVWQSRLWPMTTVGIQQCEEYLLQRHIHRSESFFPSKMIRKTTREKNMVFFWCNPWDSWFPIIFRSQSQLKIQISMGFFIVNFPCLLVRPAPDSASFSSWKKFRAEEILPAISALRTKAWNLHRSKEAWRFSSLGYNLT